MTKEKIKPNVKKIRDLQDEFQLTVREVGKLFKENKIDLSERTYSSIISGKNTSRKQLSKILDLFEIIGIKKNQILGLTVSDLISNKPKQIEYNLFFDHLTEENIGRSNLFFKWEEKSKIFRYLIKLDSRSADLVSSFI